MVHCGGQYGFEDEHQKEVSAGLWLQWSYFFNGVENYNRVFGNVLISVTLNVQMVVNTTCESFYLFRVKLKWDVTFVKFENLTARFRFCFGSKGKALSIDLKYPHCMVQWASIISEYLLQNNSLWFYLLDSIRCYDLNWESPSFGVC